LEKKQELKTKGEEKLTKIVAELVTRSNPRRERLQSHKLKRGNGREKKVKYVYNKKEMLMKQRKFCGKCKEQLYWSEVKL
jgi:hypothetical protein